jgi:ubiquinol-cytochrome c reductase cytochrome b subunit/menaquinol-cytochrome c reductase cytochrome b/c subunit
MANRGPVEHPPSGQGPTALAIEPPPSVIRADGRQLAEYRVGRTVAAQSGCLACHRIGEAGTNGPGPDLTAVAARLPRAAIARAVVHATPPMPSFARMPQAKLRALVEFLSLLR